MNELGIVLWPVLELLCLFVFFWILCSQLSAALLCLFVLFAVSRLFCFCTPQVMLDCGQSAEREQSRVAKGETLKCELLEKTSEIFHVKSRF